MNNDETFNTTDLILASTISLYYPIDGIDKLNPQKVIFVFKIDEQFSQLLKKYWRRELVVEPISFFNQIKYLKSRIYEF